MKKLQIFSFMFDATLSEHYKEQIETAQKIDDAKATLRTVVNSELIVFRVMEKIEYLAASGPAAYSDIVLPWLEKTIEEAFQGKELTILNKQYP